MNGQQIFAACVGMAMILVISIWAITQCREIMSDFRNDMAAIRDKESAEAAGEEGEDSKRFRLLIDEIFYRLEERDVVIANVKALVFMRLNAARDRRDKKAIEIYRELQEVLK